MRKRTLRVVAVVLMLLCATTLWAASTPFIQGLVGGIELCPQFICGAAIFVGEFRGTIGNNPYARGIISTAMKHEDLPPPNEDANITGGLWQLQTLTRTIGGRVVTGTIHNNDDGTFQVVAELRLGWPNSGNVFFVGQLNHNTTIPTFGGVLLQALP